MIVTQSNLLRDEGNPRELRMRQEEEGEDGRRCARHVRTTDTQAIPPVTAHLKRRYTTAAKPNQQPTTKTGKAATDLRAFDEHQPGFFTRLVCTPLCLIDQRDNW